MVNEQLWANQNAINQEVLNFAELQNTINKLVSNSIIGIQENVTALQKQVAILPTDGGSMVLGISIIALILGIIAIAIALRRKK